MIFIMLLFASVNQTVARIAAMHPMAEAVIAWRKVLSEQSPATNTFSMFVFTCVPGRGDMDPSSSRSRRVTYRDKNTLAGYFCFRARLYVADEYAAANSVFVRDYLLDDAVPNGLYFRVGERAVCHNL